MSDERRRAGPARAAIGAGAPGACAVRARCGLGAAGWRWLVPCALVMAFVAGPGCGRRAGPFGTPRATLNTLLARAQAGAKEDVMACFSHESRELLHEMEQEAARLAAPISAVLGPLDGAERRLLERFGAEAGRVQVRREQIDPGAGRAVLAVAFGDGPVQTFEFVREVDGWKVDVTGELRPVRALLDSIGKLSDPVRERLAEIRAGPADAAR